MIRRWFNSCIRSRTGFTGLRPAFWNGLGFSSEASQRPSKTLSRSGRTDTRGQSLSSILGHPRAIWGLLACSLSPELCRKLHTRGPARSERGWLAGLTCPLCDRGKSFLACLRRRHQQQGRAAPSAVESVSNRHRLSVVQALRHGLLEGPRHRATAVLSSFQLDASLKANVLAV